MNNKKFVPELHDIGKLEENLDSCSDKIVRLSSNLKGEEKLILSSYYGMAAQAISRLKNGNLNNNQRNVFLLNALVYMDKIKNIHDNFYENYH